MSDKESLHNPIILPGALVISQRVEDVGLSLQSTSTGRYLLGIKGKRVSLLGSRVFDFPRGEFMEKGIFDGEIFTVAEERE